jgi:hypothetical protein
MEVVEKQPSRRGGRIQETASRSAPAATVGQSQSSSSGAQPQQSSQRRLDPETKKKLMQVRG